MKMNRFGIYSAMIAAAGTMLLAAATYAQTPAPAAPAAPAEPAPAPLSTKTL